MSAEKARIGVIGCGWWSSYAHLPALERNPRAVIAGIADPDAAKLEAATAQFPVERALSSAEALLESADLDGVVIAVPHAFHFEVARQALEHDVHVLLEKPMVLEPEHGRALVEEASRRARALVIGYPWHYNRHALAVREAIARGEIGELEFVACLFASVVRELYRGNPEAYAGEFGYTWNTPGRATYSDPAIAGGGQGQTQITHSGALLFWLTGLRPREVFAYSENFELGMDLADAVSIRFAGDALGSLASIGSMSPGHQEVLEYRLFGQTGHILLDVTGGTCSIHRADGSVSQLPELEVRDRYPAWAPADNLVGIALGEQENGSPSEIGLLAVEFLDAMYRSAREGIPVAPGQN